MSVVAALAAVMEDVRAVRKGDFNNHQKFSFRGIDSVVNAVGPALRKHGVVVVPLVQSVDYDSVRTSQDKPATACRVVVEYVFHGPDGDSLTSRVAAEAWDSGDKACPKAMSVAFRTALLQALTLPTDEPDPDSHTYEQVDNHQLELNRAKAAVKAAWEKSRSWDAEGMMADFEQWAAMPISEADAPKLTEYAAYLGGSDGEA